MRLKRDESVNLAVVLEYVRATCEDELVLAAANSLFEPMMGNNERTLVKAKYAKTTVFKKVVAYDYPTVAKIVHGGTYFRLWDTPILEGYDGRNFYQVGEDEWLEQYSFVIMKD